MSQLLIVVVVVLLPGILAASIAGKLTIHLPWDSFKFTLYALVFGVLNYSLLQILLYAWDVLRYIWNTENSTQHRAIVWTSLTVWNIARKGSSIISSLEIVSSVFLAVPVSFLVAACVEHKMLTRIGSWMRVTSKYGEENLYSYFMNMKENEWIYVRDKENNLTYEGKASWHSENESLHELVLQDVVVYRYEDSARLYSVPTMYLSREVGKLVIESVPRELVQEGIADEHKVGD
jgi:hypothetical protein